MLTTIPQALKELKFEKGWGVLEIQNSFLEIYPRVGYFFALLGFFSVLTQKEIKKYLIFIFWPIILLWQIFIFRQTEVAYLVPYQRAFYYFALSLPVLSAFGLFYSITLIKKISIKKVSVILIIILITLTTIAACQDYKEENPSLALYKLVNSQDLATFDYMKKLPSATVLAPLDMSAALYVFTKHKPVATIFFYGNKTQVENFISGDCQEKEEIIQETNASYIISTQEINCGWQIINQESHYIYKTS